VTRCANLAPHDTTARQMRQRNEPRSLAVRAARTKPSASRHGKKWDTVNSIRSRYLQSRIRPVNFCLTQKILHTRNVTDATRLGKGVGEDRSNPRASPTTYRWAGTQTTDVGLTKASRLPRNSPLTGGAARNLNVSTGCNSPCLARGRDADAPRPWTSLSAGRLHEHAMNARSETGRISTGASGLTKQTLDADAWTALGRVSKGARCTPRTWRSHRT